VVAGAGTGKTETLIARIRYLVSSFDVSAGILVGLGLSGTGFGVVMGVVGRAAPADKRSAALGLVGAGGSFGQFAMLPYAQTLIAHFGWLSALLVLAATSLMIIPLASALAGRNVAANTSDQSLTAAIREAAAHKGYWFLTLSFMVCGFQTLFVMIHLPAYLVDQGMTPTDGMTALAAEVRKELLQRSVSVPLEAWRRALSGDVRQFLMRGDYARAKNQLLYELGITE